LNFEFQFNNKENLGMNANITSSIINDCHQIPVLPSYVKETSENKLKNPSNIFENYDFNEIIQYDASQKEKPEADVFQKIIFKNSDSENINMDFEDNKKKSIKTPFVKIFFCF